MTYVLTGYNKTTTPVQVYPRQVSVITQSVHGIAMAVSIIFVSPFPDQSFSPVTRKQPWYACSKQVTLFVYGMAECRKSGMPILRSIPLDMINDWTAFLPTLFPLK